MKEQEISLETAKLAKLKGFDWECRGYYCPPRKQGNKYTEHYGYFNSNKCQFYIDDKGIKREVEMYSAPTQSLLQRWLRDVHNIHIRVYLYEFDIYLPFGYNILYKVGNAEYFNCILDKHPCVNYELALETALIEALNLL